MSGLRSLLLAGIVTAVVHGAAAAEPAPRLTYVSLNVLHGGMFSGLRGNGQELERRLEMITAELRALAPDVVGLQEASVGRDRGHVARRLAEALGFRWVYSPALVGMLPFAWMTRLASMAMNFEEGPAILSRFPIVAWEAHPLPRCNGAFDPRVLVRATLDTRWGPLTVGSTHTSRGFCEAARVRELITAHRGPLPVVLMGDFNAGPDSAPIRTLTEEAGLVDVFHAVNPAERGPTVWQHVFGPSPTVRRRVDFIFMLPGTKVPGRVVSSRLVVNTPGRLPDGRPLWPSDHYGVLAEIELRPAGATTATGVT
ncbi:MAG: endonuclease/exonuclease/phosphatase family protein, partial [Candidatus Rokuibacteriota bacterium]